MRIFFGCFLTPTAARELMDRAPEVPGLRPVPVENLHVTLHFLGSVAADRAEDVRVLAAGLPAVSLCAAVREITGFPKPGRARMLVARLTDPDGQLGHWHEALARGWPTGEKRRYDPHVTLGRSRYPVKLPMMPALNGVALELEPPAAYVSDTLPEGARYRRLG